MPRVGAGLFARIGAFLCGGGSGASAARRLRGVSLAFRVAVSTGLLCLVFAGSAVAATTAGGSGSVLTSPLTSITPAVASGPPQIEAKFVQEQVWSTRLWATAETYVGSIVVPGTWHAEYATSEKLLEEGEGTPAGSGEIPVPPPGASGRERMEVGEGYIGERLLHHLLPETTYYLRFEAEDEAGTTPRTLTFTTLPVAKPEIATYISRGGGGDILKPSSGKQRGRGRPRRLRQKLRGMVLQQPDINLNMPIILVVLGYRLRPVL